MSERDPVAPADSGPAFAAYFNVARHNLLLALNGVAEKTGLRPIDNDSDLIAHPVLQQLGTWANLEKDDKPISDKEIRIVRRMIKGVQKALPILADEFTQAVSGQKISKEFKRSDTKFERPAFDDKTQRTPAEKTMRNWRIADFEWVLRMLAETLMALRNFHTHAYQAPANTDKELLNLLGTWFDAGRREAKSRFEFLENEMAHLLRHNPNTKRENPDALHALSRPERGAKKLTERGAAFFCCLFLEKQQAHEFLSQLRGFKHNQGRFHQATLRTYGHWSIRLPFVRIDTSSTAQSLALDMMNELARCPAEIYEHLADEDQKKFEVGADTDADWLQPEGGSPDEDDSLRTRFIRHGDRFAPLMMDYLDQAASANAQHDTGIRFQLDLGDFYFAAYDKRLPDGSTDIRRLKQKVLRFGLLSQALQQSQLKPSGWSTLERVNAERDFAQPYIVQTRAHYHRPEGGGSIAIQLAPDRAPHLYGEPQPNPSKPGQLRPLTSERPDFWLSPYELVNLGFYQHLRVAHAISLPEAQFPKVRHLLSAYRASLERLYKDIQKQPDHWYSPSAHALGSKLQNFCQSSSGKAYYTLRPKDLPADLQALLLDQVKAPQHKMQQQASNTLALLAEDGYTRLRDVQRAKQSLTERIKPGKSAHRVLHAGDMATFLAKDMLRMQPVQDVNSAHKGKPTSIMADLLQARLAYFGRDKTSLPALLNSLKLTGNANASQNHPFLHRIVVNAPGMNGIAQYYEAYLRERQAHLHDLQSQLAQGSISLQHTSLAWLHLAQTPQRMLGKDNLSALLDLYLARMQNADEPLNLPRGLFKELIVNALLNLNKPDLTKNIQQALDKEKVRGMPTSVSYLIDQYFALVQGDSYQDFYCYEMPKLNQRLQEANTQAWQETHWAENAEKALRKEHRGINRQEINQRLAVMWKDRTRTLSQFDKELAKQMRLRSTQDQVLFLAAKHLIELSEAKEPKRKATDTTAQTSLLDTIKLQTLQREDLGEMVPHHIRIGDKTIYTDKIKAKNIHEFKRLARDRRLPGLLHYYDAQRIALGVVAHELQAYPRAQLQAFTEVLAFERQHNQQQKLQASQLSSGQSLHRTLLERRVQRSPQHREQHAQHSAEALTLRNAFCHNQMPAPSNAKDPAAQPMLAQARQSLAPARQEAADISLIKSGGSVAQHFANALRERYQHLS